MCVLINVYVHMMFTQLCEQNMHFTSIATLPRTQPLFSQYMLHYRGSAVHKCINRLCLIIKGEISDRVQDGRHRKPQLVSKSEVIHI